MFHFPDAPSEPSGLEHRTMASQLVEAIRLDIIRGVLPPNSKLRIASLAERYSAGSIPLREALSRLTASGFVHAIDQRGFIVAPVLLEELMDITQLRAELESIALRASITHGDLAWEQRVVAAHHRLSRLSAFDGGGQLDKNWEDANLQFHRALLSASGSPWLMRFIDILSDQASKYRHLSAPVSSASDRDVGAEHQAIVTATINRDADTATRLLVDHYQKTADLVLAAIQRQRAQEAAVRPA